MQSSLLKGNFLIVEMELEVGEDVKMHLHIFVMIKSTHLLNCKGIWFFAYKILADRMDLFRLVQAVVALAYGMVCMTIISASLSAVSSNRDKFHKNLHDWNKLACFLNHCLISDTMLYFCILQVRKSIAF